jgi:3-oxoacyl-(acyl-carrier-protein) synthase
VVSVLGSAVQQDGPSASLTAPNGSSQRRLIDAVRCVLSKNSGVPTLEAHGTGTALGDPIEVTRDAREGGYAKRSGSTALWQVGAADRAFSSFLRALGAPSQGRGGPVQCASLKSNLGHLEAAAAAAGLASLAVGPLSTGIVVVNAQLRGLAAAVQGEEVRK